jgi:hypothetical protein
MEAAYLHDVFESEPDKEQLKYPKSPRPVHLWYLASQQPLAAALPNRLTVASNYRVLYRVSKRPQKKLDTPALIAEEAEDAGID